MYIAWTCYPDVACLLSEIKFCGGKKAYSFSFKVKLFIHGIVHPQ